MKRLLKLGSLAALNILHYYRASILAGLVKHYNSNYRADWKTIEFFFLFPYMFPEPLWNSKSLVDQPSICSWLFLESEFKIWMSQRSILSPAISPLTVYLGQRWFQPGRSTSSFKLWRRLGINTFQSFLSGEKLVDKSILDDKYKTNFT